MILRTLIVPIECVIRQKRHTFGSITEAARQLQTGEETRPVKVDHCFRVTEGHVRLFAAEMLGCGGVRVQLAFVNPKVMAEVMGDSPPSM